MSWIDSSVNFFANKKYRLSQKAAVGVLIITGLFLVDNLFNFSFHYRTVKKLEEFEKINAILKDSSLDSTTKSYAVNIRNQILTKKNIPDYLTGLFRKRPAKPNSNIVTPTENKNDSTIPYDFWFFFSSIGIIFTLATLKAITQSFFEKKQSFIQSISEFIVFVVFLYVFGAGLILLFRLIPIISSKTLFYNYLINFIIQFTMIALITWMISINLKKQEKEAINQ